MPDKSTLIVGGSGFIGMRLAERLQHEGSHVKIMDLVAPSDALPLDFEFVHGDIRSIADLEMAMSNVDVVYNLAAVHRDDIRPISLYTDVNVTGARNLCEAAATMGIRRIIFTSSVAVYGSQNVPLTEDSAHNFINEYGESKHLAEKEYRIWLDANSANSLSIVRPTVVFGKGNRGNIYNLLRQLKYGPFIMIGDGRNVKSMAHVENVASFLAFLKSRSNRYEVFNYSDGPDFSMIELVRFVDSALGRSHRRGPAMPLWAGLLVGQFADLVAAAASRPLPISKVRVEKFCASSAVRSDRVLASGFVAPVALSEGLIEMAREFV